MTSPSRVMPVEWGALPTGRVVSRSLGILVTPVKRGHELYEVVCDRREGWMTLWRRVDEARNERVQEVQIIRLDEAATLEGLGTWIARTSVACRRPGRCSTLIAEYGLAFKTTSPNA